MTIGGETLRLTIGVHLGGLMRLYYVYIVTNRPYGVLYTGMTNDLELRVYQHREKLVPGFTSRYDCRKLVYFEETDDVAEAITREKQIKGWLRSKKIALIESMNSEWEDLAAEWY